MTVTNWSRRYRTGDVNRMCARPGCEELATTTLRFQPTRREALLVDVDQDAPRTSGDLCDQHALTLELPRGWQLHDQRSSSVGEVTLVVVREETVEIEVAPVAEIPVAVAVEPEPDAVVIELTPASAPLLETATEEAEVETEALAEVLDASTPLLKRAFGNVILPD